MTLAVENNSKFEQNKGFIQQLQEVNYQVDDAEGVKRKQAELVNKWMQEKPLAFFAEIREKQPIFSTPKFTIVTRYTDVMEVFHNDDVFTVDIFTSKVNRTLGAFLLGMGNSPEYERQKSILRLAFRREDADRFREIVQEESVKLLENIANSEFNLVEYAQFLPAIAMRRYLGLEEISVEQIVKWTHPIFQDIFVNIADDDRIKQQAAIAKSEAAPLLDELIASRHQYLQENPHQVATTVLDRLLSMQEISNTRLSNEEVRNCLLGFFVGTIDLTSVAIINSVVELLKRPPVLTQAMEAAQEPDNQAIAGYVLEALRFRPPGTGLFRLCKQDYTLARGTAWETQIKANTLIYSASASAMHDPTYVDAPEEFRVGRPQQCYLFFESGLHTCFGKYFSLVQIPLAVKGLLRLGKLEIAGELVRADGFPVKLPMRITHSTDYT